MRAQARHRCWSLGSKGKKRHLCCDGVVFFLPSKLLRGAHLFASQSLHTQQSTDNIYIEKKRDIQRKREAEGWTYAPAESLLAATKASGDDYDSGASQATKDTAALMRPAVCLCSAKRDNNNKQQRRHSRDSATNKAVLCQTTNCMIRLLEFHCLIFFFKHVKLLLCLN